MGLKTKNGGCLQISNWLEVCFQNINQLGDFKAENFSWFQVADGGATEESTRSYKFEMPPCIKAMEVKIDRAAVFRRWAGSHAFSDLAEFGSILIPGFWDWFLKEKEL